MQSLHNLPKSRAAYDHSFFFSPKHHEVCSIRPSHNLFFKGRNHPDFVFEFIFCFFLFSYPF